MATNGCSLAFPQFGEGGTWVVQDVQLQDAVGNRRDYPRPNCGPPDFRRRSVSLEPGLNCSGPPGFCTFTLQHRHDGSARDGSGIVYGGR